MQNKPSFPYNPNNNAQFRPRRPQKVYVPINEYIRARTLRVIDHLGNNLGEISKEEALKLAQEAGLDLFVISEKTDVPVAKIVDYGKYKFEQNKKEKQQKKKQSANEFKEIKMGINIDIGDYNTRLGHAKKFLGKQIRVKLNITLRGREMEHSFLAVELAERFLDDLRDLGYSEAPVPKRPQGRSIIVYIIPGPDKVRIKKFQDLKKDD